MHGVLLKAPYGYTFNMNGYRVQANEQPKSMNMLHSHWLRISIHLKCLQLPYWLRKLTYLFVAAMLSPHGYLENANTKCS